MKRKYWLCRRKCGFFSFDSETGKRESLHTDDRDEAQRILRAKNDAALQPAINISIAKAYLVGRDPKLVERTWAIVIREFCTVKKESSRLRRERAVKGTAFNFIRNKRLVETTPEDFYAVLKSGGVFVNQVLRCLHNLALGMGWILAPVIPPKLWPKMEKKFRRAITSEEHLQIIEAENNSERKMYYELLWEIGAAQTDGANLMAANIDWENWLRAGASRMESLSPRSRFVPTAELNSSMGGFWTRAFASSFLAMAAGATRLVLALPLFGVVAVIGETVSRIVTDRRLRARYQAAQRLAAPGGKV